MKSIIEKYFSLITFIILIFGELNAQIIPISKDAKFKREDNMDFAKQSYNDNEWEIKQLGTTWKALDLNGNVFAWYRIKIIIPSSLKADVIKSRGLKLNLGKIDDVDQTYFNGKLIGETGTLPPNYQSKWDTNRTYTIAENIIQWDQENTIAIRIFSLDNVGIGMYQGPYNYEPIGWTDNISVKEEIIETESNGFIPRIILTNKAENIFDGTVKYWISDNTNTVLFTDTKHIHVQPRIGAESIVSFSNFQPRNGDIFKVGYQINVDNSAIIQKNERLYLANKNIKIPVGNEVKPLVENKIKDNYTSIPFQNQQLNGYLGKRLTQNLEERLLNVDEEGLMGSYLQRPGIHPWAGEHVGKYLETACNVWRNTHDVRLKKQMDRMMYELINSQLKDGYLGTYTPEDYWTSWDVWSHKYNLHGLLTYYATTGYMPALEASKKMGDLLCKTFGKNTGQRDIILAGEHKGMAATSVLDAMVDLYRYSGDKKYLDFCYYILDAWEQENGPHVISAILKTGKVTDVGNRKAYEMMSNYVGLIKLYQVTGDAKFLKAVEMAWQDVTKNRLYITGTASDHEHFQEDGMLPAEANSNMGEGCVTTTWVQLNQNLFAITGDIKYLNQLEKSVYNQLLGAENPETGCVSYYTPLQSKKPYTCFITCCESSVPRGISFVPNFTFGNIKNIPTVLFYEPGVYKESITTSSQKKIDATFNIEGNFPESGKLTITVETSKTAEFPLALRVPLWCTNFVAKVGNKVYKGLPNEFVTIKKMWKSGEKISVNFDMPIQQISGGKSYPNQIAFQRGPQVLAVDKSLNSEKAFDLIANSKENIAVRKPNPTNESKILPKNWIGNQAYSLDILNEKIFLVPFAEASQTEGDMRVWLPLNIKK
ncbi:MAG: beta-L-arabinofuranosidase domain-containing protein [Paludibacter sp.]